MSSPQAAAAVVTEGLAVGYDSGAVVEGIDISLAPGTSLALVGTNGSGKTTLLRTLVGLLAPAAGEVTVLGGPPRAARPRVAYLSQHRRPDFVLPLRSVDVVRMGRYPARGLFGRLREHDRQIVNESMERMGVAGIAATPLGHLSGGQQRRVHLAQVLAQAADLLVLDEPTAGIDAAGREHYLQAVADETARGATVVTATHDIREAAACTQVLLLAHRVVAYGSPDEALQPEYLLETFGVALESVGPDGYVATEQGHAHDHRGGPLRGRS